MRDMLDSDEPYPLTAWSAQFQRIRTDLDDALRTRAGGGRVAADAGAARSTSRARSRSSGTPPIGCLRWRHGGQEAEARAQIRLSLQARQAALSTSVARLLRENNEAEEADGAPGSRTSTARSSARCTCSSPPRSSRSSLTSLYLIRSNRRLFARLASLSDQRRELAQQMIATREVHAARDLPRAPRRVRPDADGDGIDAEPRRPAHAGGLAAARRAARDRRDRADDARQRPGPVAVAAPVDSRGSGPRTARSSGISRRWNGSSGVAVSYERSGTPAAWTAPSPSTSTACCRKP